MLFKKINQGFTGISSDVTTLVSQGTELVGDVNFTGTLEILGSVVGNINSEHESARVRVLKGGSVEGDIKASIIDINGSVKGNIFALQHVSLEADSRVDGNLHYTNMEVRPGAQWVGACVFQPPQPKSQIASQGSVDEPKVKDIRASNQQALDKQWQ